MTQEIKGAGGGGKGGGGGRVAVEAPDSLRSKQYVTVIDAISEGEIGGLVDGLKSIYLDETPLVAADGSYNFQGVSYQFSNGPAGSGGYAYGYFPTNGVQTSSVVGVEVGHAMPVVRAITNPEVDWVDVVVGFPQLTEQNPKNGDMNGATVEYAVELQSNGGGFMPQVYSQLWKSDGMTQLAVAHVISNDYDARVIRIWVPTIFLNEGAYMQFRQDGGDWMSWGIKTGRGGNSFDLNNFIYSEDAQGLKAESYLETPTLANGKWEARIVRADGSPIPSTYYMRDPRYDDSEPQYVGVPVEVRYERMIGVGYEIITGKTTSRYQRSYRVKLTGQAPWDIRVRRVTPDSTSTALQNKLYWDAYVEGVDVKLNYANTAALMLTVDSQQFNSVPNRGYEIYGLKVKVPSNYNPTTRQYTGAWDGTFKIAWTDNPAWCYYDMLTNTRYGLGEFVSAENVDKWGLYTISKYCDELVPDGMGGMEPRFTCNLYLQTREDAFRVISSMASIFRGMCYWANDQITAVQDAPADPVALFTAANVIEGAFNYQGSDRRARHTVALVSWNDPKDFYKQKIEYIQDDEAVLRNGVIDTEILAVGCTSRGQAHRVGRWLLHTERYETETVSFKAGLDSARVGPGDIILTQDAIRAGKRMGGRIKGAISASQIQLDAPVDVTSGEINELSLVMPDGSVETRRVINTPGTGITSILVNPAFSALPVDNAIWVLSMTTLVPERWRVVSVSESDPTTVEITAVAHNPGKYTAVEQNLQLQELPTSSISAAPETPTNLSAFENSYPLAVGAPAFRMTLSWTSNASRYVVQWRKLGDNWATANTTSAQLTFDNITEGDYEFKVQALNSLGKSSPLVPYSFSAKCKLPLPDVVPNVALTINSKSTVMLSWGQISNPYAVLYEVRNSDTNWGKPGAIFQGSSLSCPVIPLGAGMESTFYVRAIDYQGQPSSVSAVATLTVTAPSAPVVSGAFEATNLILTWAEPESMFNVASYEVRQGSSWATAQVVGKIQGTQLTIPVTWMGSRTFLVAAIDSLGNVGAPASKVFTSTAPGPVSGITMLYDLAQARLSWSNNATSLPIAYNEVRRGTSWESGTLVGKSFTNTLNLEVSWQDSATFWIRSVDTNGNASTDASYVTTVSAPGAVSVAHQFKDGNAILNWATPTGGSMAISHYEVREGATWSTGTVVGSTTDTSYSIPVNWTSSKTFWVAAVDMAGNVGTAGSRSVSYTAYAAPLGLSQSISQATVTLTWQGAGGGSLPIKHYDIRFGGEWSSGQVLAKSNTTSITLPVTWLGNLTLWVAAVDTNDQFGAPSSIVVSVSAPSAPSVSSALVVAKAEISWSVPSATLPLQQYEIRHGASWATGTMVARTLATNYRAPVEWVGTRTYWVAAIDVNGNTGTAGSTSVAVSAPPAPALSSSFSLDQFNLAWVQPESSLPIDEFEVRYGTSWAAGTSLGRIKGTVFTKKAQWVGARSWWVAAVDINGNVGTPGNISVTINAPSAPVITKQVVDNNVLLYWEQSTGTLPILTYEVRRGTNWDTATMVGQKSGGFTTIFETSAGIYNYMLSAVDSAGNFGAPSSVSVSVSQPPDYVLKADDDLDFSGIKVNMQPAIEGGYMMPVNTTETFAEHFSSRAWAGPDAQIAAGFPVFAQPALSPGYYEHDLDYGTLLSGTKVTVTPTGAVVAGSPMITIDISTRVNPTDAWTLHPNSAEVYTSNFRYVRVRMTVSGTQADLYRLEKINVKLDAKIRNDAGTSVLKLGGAHANGNIVQDYVSLWKADMAMPPAGYSLNGSTLENKIVSKPGPSGLDEPLWACVDVDAASDAEGGWNGAYLPADCASTGHLFAVFMKTTTNNGSSYMGTNQNGKIATLAGVAESNPYFLSGGDLPALNTWYLVVGYVHQIGYGTANTNIAGIYDLAGNRITAGTEFKALAGCDSLMLRAYHYYNTGATGTETQYMARPVVIPCSEAEAADKIGYILRCALQPGASAEFNVPFIDITSVAVSPNSTTPTIPVYDLLDLPNPKRFNIFNYTTAGAHTAGTVAWSARGY